MRDWDPFDFLILILGTMLLVLWLGPHLIKVFR